MLPSFFVTRRGLMLASAAAFLALSAVTPGMAQVQPGKPAPDFTAVDTKGKTVRLSDFRGKPVVLEWTNHECPYVSKHYVSGNMQALQREAAQRGVIWLTVASIAPGQMGFLDGLEADALIADRKAEATALLLDPTTELAALYHARASLHVFLINADGVLAYTGAIDDNPSANPADFANARNYLREAIAAVTAGQPVPVSSTRPYGCPIKLIRAVGSGESAKARSDAGSEAGSKSN